MVAGRCVAQKTDAEEERQSKEEECVARLQEAGDSADTTPLQTDPLGHAKQSPGCAFLHPEVPSSDVDPGVGFHSPEIQDPARLQQRRERRTETPKEEEDDEPGERDAETPGRTGREELLEDTSSHHSASHVPGGMWLSQRQKRNTSSNTELNYKSPKDFIGSSLSGDSPFFPRKEHK
ncbi:hypothetical protein NDU88_004066 [Pleurodeles waltl]|uniref:Uncharacterized protein n=1 Tax=Pleurodeles waltl TaxID=8319 RepID=A0AAV7VF77_PLEWA|nr:hypothetical protein NDU88_004066 [Pleurodeles waltl]